MLSPESQSGVVLASFHGHSPYSDGLSDIRSLVRAARRANVRYFGISDHNTAQGVRELHDEVSRINQTFGTNIVPVSAVEITTNQGDVLLAVPGNYDSAFVNWSNRWSEERHRYGMSETIAETVEAFNALCVIVHPGEVLLAGASFAVIRDLRQELTDGIVEKVGLETRNWATLLLTKRARVREAAVDRLAGELRLARFGFSDFHHYSMISRQVTRVETGDHSASGLVEAVRLRKVSPEVADKPHIVNLARLALIFGISHLLPHYLEARVRLRRLFLSRRPDSAASNT